MPRNTHEFWLELDTAVIQQNLNFNLISQDGRCDVDSDNHLHHVGLKKPVVID